jgi:hypothetical protein
VEAVVLHAAPDGGVAPAHICRGAGSFEAVMHSLGETLPGGASGDADAEAAAPGAQGAGEQREELPQAATVS